MILFVLTDYEDNLIHVGSEKDCKEIADDPSFPAGIGFFINPISPKQLLLKLARQYWSEEEDNDGQILFYTGITKE